MWQSFCSFCSCSVRMFAAVLSAQEGDAKNNESGVVGLLGLSMLNFSSNWIEAFLQSTEDGVSELSQIVYRVIKSLHTNTCQLRSHLTKTVHLIPPAVHLQPTRNGQHTTQSHCQTQPERWPLSLSVFWMLLEGMIRVIKILTQLALHCWPCLQVRMLYLSSNAITAAIFSYLISSSACFSCWRALAVVNTEKCFSWTSSSLHSSSHLFQNNFCRCWKEWLSGWRVGGQVDAALIASEDCICCCYSVVFHTLHLCLYKPGLGFAQSVMYKCEKCCSE